MLHCKGLNMSSISDLKRRMASTARWMMTLEFGHTGAIIIAVSAIALLLVSIAAAVIIVPLILVILVAWLIVW